MAGNLKETALRLLKKNIVTWLRDNSYQQLRRNAKESVVYPDGHEIIVDENDIHYVLEKANLYCGYCIISRRKLTEVDGVKLPTSGELHELY